MYFVYAIKSRKRKYIYVGITNNINRRINQHQNGKEQTTRAYSPFDIVLTEVLETRERARAREKYLKSGSGKEFLKGL